jgi:hypothetical protein
MDGLQSRLWYGVEADTGSYAASMIEADSKGSECEIERTRVSVTVGLPS